MRNFLPVGLSNHESRTRDVGPSGTDEKIEGQALGSRAVALEMYNFMSKGV